MSRKGGIPSTLIRRLAMNAKHKHGFEVEEEKLEAQFSNALAWLTAVSVSIAAMALS
jgi:hypothetical protein